MAVTGISQRAFARLAKVTPKAVRKAIAAGRIDVLPNGTIDADAALKRWAATTDPARSRVGTMAGTTKAKPTAGRTGAVTGDTIRRVLGQGADSGKSIGFGEARTTETILRVHEREMKLAERRKLLVPAAKVRAHVARAFDSFCRVIRGLPGRHAADIAAGLGCDAVALELALSKAIAVELAALSVPVIRT